MKKLILFFAAFVFSATLVAQPSFDLGLKAGLNNSKVTLNRDKINAESILKYHIGAFGRVGFGKIFIQPEAYYSAKGGRLEGDFFDVATKFNFYVVDIPLLAGIKIIDGERANVRLQAGPVFSILTSNEITGDELLDPDYYKSNYLGFQYGIGADVFGFTLDLRMENGSNKLYQHPDSDLNGKNNTFMISVGYKIF